MKHAIATFVVSPQPFGKSAFQKELTYAISNKWHVVDNNIILDMSALNTGMYVVQISTQKNTFTARVVKG